MLAEAQMEARAKIKPLPTSFVPKPLEYTGQRSLPRGDMPLSRWSVKIGTKHILPHELSGLCPNRRRSGSLCGYGLRLQTELSPKGLKPCCLPLSLQQEGPKTTSTKYKINESQKMQLLVSGV